MAGWPPRRGGAVAFRADGAQDILAIRESVELPIIGSRKSSYASSPVCITPTFDEAADAFQSGANVVAVDGTQRPRPRGEDLAGLIARIHAELAVPVLADVGDVEDGARARTRRRRGRHHAGRLHWRCRRGGTPDLRLVQSPRAVDVR
jgi:N-acylglucosamine-6-phosphate 2-epimerase